MRISDWSSDVCSSDLRTATACRCTFLHTVEPVAACSAGPADLGAFAADMFVMVGIASHDFQRYRAYLGTVEHQFHMGRFGVLSAHLEAVGPSHREAQAVTFVAGIPSLIHFGVGVGPH